MKKLRKLWVAVCVFAAVLLAVPSVVPGTPDFFAAEAATRVKLNKTKASLIKGQTLQLKLSGAKGKISWSSSNKKVASVSGKGKVTAKAKGSTTISAKYNKKKYTCNLTVETPKLNKTSLTLKKGKTYQLKFSGTKQKVSWTTSNKSVATVSQTGKVTAKKAGSVNITGTINKKKYTCKVKVTSGTVSVTKVELSEKSLELNVGDSKRLYATVYPYNATNQSITWTSNNPSVAAVSSYGKVSAKKAGTAVITANVGSKKAVCKITVKKNSTANLRQLAEYIQIYGYENSEGNNFIKYTYNGVAWGIVYDWAEDNLKFICTANYDTASTSMEMCINIPQTGYTSAEYIIVFNDGYTCGKAIAQFNPATYSSEDTLHFTLVEASSGITEMDIQEVANTSLNLAFSGWQLLLMSELDMQLSDIGFVSYR